MAGEQLVFNGLDVGTGAYMFPKQSAEELARQIAGRASEQPDRETADHLIELKSRIDDTKEHLGPKAGVDVRELAEAGWAAVFPAVRPDTPEAKQQEAILEALAPLLELRRTQASKIKEQRFRVLRGVDGYRRNETKQAYLARLGAGPGAVDPDRVPYYLMIVASPDELPFSVQYQIDVQYAVGRIHFDTVAEYANYARSVVAAETGDLQLPRELAAFAVANKDDPATQLSAKNLVAPLVDLVTAQRGDWKVRRFGVDQPEKADKAALARMLGGESTPALLFTASHGAGFSKGHADQRRHQGALVCQDWPGPVDWGRKPVPPDHYFSADDLGAGARPHGAIVFNFACYGAGTPLYNDYGRRTGATEREAIADGPFISALHQRLLGLPSGGALAAVGHVERAWGCSFMWPGTNKRNGSGAQLSVFESALMQILDGYPIGAALEWFNQRYAELASDLSAELENIDFGRTYNAMELADMWTANNDARGYAITGDPAVRVHAAAPGQQARRAELAAIELHTAAAASVASTTVTATSASPPASSASPTATATSASPTASSASPNAASASPTRTATSASPTATSTNPTSTSPTPTSTSNPTPTASPTATATSSTPTPATPGSGYAFGLTGDPQAAVAELARTLGVVTVRTYSAADLAAAASAGPGELAATAELRAFTRIHPNGDVEVCLPADADAATVLQAHASATAQAQAHRLALLRALAGEPRGSGA